MGSNVSWINFQNGFLFDRSSGFALDTSRLALGSDYLEKMKPQTSRALEAMAALEKGEIANPDENRMVGHYWLRDSALAPSEDLSNQIQTTVASIKKFAADVHSGKVRSQEGHAFRFLLVVGIGGSALGPQFIFQALGGPGDRMALFFFDNTDPDGMAKVLAQIPSLAETLVVVISKSGGTKETRNGQLIAKQAFKSAGLDFASRFVAVTGESSELDRTAQDERWIARFPMWDWVGGRTSVFSAVGLLPMALLGVDLDEILAGARHMDQMTRVQAVEANPAMMLALGWYHCGCGRGNKDMVVLPYKDRLELMSRYLQQLVMESIGKELDLNGKTVNQGLAVYGNKGSTDQHAYVQQLRDGVHNFFGVFIHVRKDPSPASVNVSDGQQFLPWRFEVEPGITAGDYLTGFYLGTRTALAEKGRESLSICIDEVSARSIGMLIALFERAVGFYATFVNVNAYHQPGVEAGKKAAAAVLEIQAAVLTALREVTADQSVEEVATRAGVTAENETVFTVLRHLAANGRVRVTIGESVFDDRYRIVR
jgi:glucose-6-phosphate isomerase